MNSVLKRRDAVEILRMHLASRLGQATVLGFAILCAIFFLSSDPALKITAAMCWLLFATVALGVGIIERHAAVRLCGRHSH